MFYLIDRGIVAQIETFPFEIAASPILFWIEAGNGVAKVGDKFINGQFQPKYNLQERREIRIGEMLSVFLAQLSSGVSFDGKDFYSDESSRNLISQALASQDRGIEVFPTQWFLKDGVAEVTYDDMKAVSALLVDKVKGCYYNREVLRQQILQSSNPESVDLSVGWPVNA